VEAKPEDAQAWKALGVAYAAQNLYLEGEPALRRACELNPKLEDACYFHARALYALDRFDGSLAVLARIAPKSWKVRLGMAQALEALGRAADAEREFRQVLTMPGPDAQTGVAFGLFLVRQGRFDEAVAPLEEVVKRFPASSEGHLHLGRALMEQGKIDGAIVQLERAVALSPGSAQGHLLLAKALVRAGRQAEAQAHLDAAARGAK